MGLPSEPIVKKFFSNKIESTRGDWYSYLIRIARIFYMFDGQDYDREKLLEQFTELSGRQSNAQRDVSNFRDEFGAYGTYLGIYHLEQLGGSWKIIVSNAAKQFLCVENPNAAAFCRAQLSLFQYPNGAGAALTASGSINVQANSRADTVREISNGIRLNPFRLICRIVVAQVELKKRPINEIAIPYETLFCMVNDDRINRTYTPDIETVASVFDEYSTAAARSAMNLEGITNFKRNFHILEKTGLFTRDSRFGLMVAQANYTAAYECIQAVSEIRTSFDAFEPLYHALNEDAVRDIIASPAWGQYYDAANLGAKSLEALGVEVDKAPIQSVGFAILEPDEEDEYTHAAHILTEYVSENGTQFSATDEEIDEFYRQFRERFSPEKLALLSDDKLLGEIFYTSDKSNDSLCYWLEFNAFCKKQFGSISGGSAYKFCLFQKQEDGIWMTGSGQKPEPLSEEEALKLGKEIRDALVAGANLIGGATLETVDDYEHLCDGLEETIGRYSGYAWVHKYYQILFPNKLVAFHIEPWQRHILYAFGIKPCDRFYARSGQISLIARKTAFNTPHFAEAIIDRFGEVIQFCRIGTADDKQSYFPEWHHRGVAAIGWNGIGSLNEFVSGGTISRQAVFEKLTEVYYPTDNRVASRKAGELVTFYAATKSTVFVAMNGEQLLAFGDDVGSYFFDDSSAFAHCRPIQWHCRFEGDERLPDKSEGLRTSCKAFTNEENIMYLYSKYYFGADIAVEGSVESDMPALEVKPRSPRTDKTHPLNQIIYGAPGTGKTYSSAEFALAIIEKRPVDLSPTDSIARQALMDRYHAKVAEGQIVFTTFHQSYGYEEFIQGIRPDSKSGAINFVKADGIFKRLADTALSDPENNYVIIIDEINRGNISKVFGELITLIEDDKRYGELNQLTVTLPMGGSFAVPNNLYIIGTMNSADKSISLIDTALRRRFEFVEMPPNSALVTVSVLREVLEKLNTYLYKELRSTDLLIGHAFFIGKDAEQLANIMNRSIIPLLYEYFYDDEAKVKKALDCIQGTDFEVDSTAGRRIRIIKKV